MTPSPQNPDIAVSVIGGYLGAGKTTLVNHILATADESIAVLVNDFGAINIDASLIEATNDTTMTLANGCICCSLTDGFVSAMETIAALDPRPERLVIEASGVADPATVAAYAHGPGFVLDATVVMIDAETVQAQAEDVYVGDTVTAHLRAADIAVVNKADLVAPSALAATIDWVTSQCPGALVHATNNAEIDSTLLFSVPPSASGDVAEGHTAHASFRSWSWQKADAPTTRASIESMMLGLDDEVLRAKGFVWLDDDQDFRYILQRVGQRWTLRRGSRWGTTQKPASTIVFIAVANPSPTGP